MLYRHAFCNLWQSLYAGLICFQISWRTFYGSIEPGDESCVSNLFLPFHCSLQIPFKQSFSRRGNTPRDRSIAVMYSISGKSRWIKIDGWAQGLWGCSARILQYWVQQNILWFAISSPLTITWSFLCFFQAGTGVWWCARTTVWAYYCEEKCQNASRPERFMIAGRVFEGMLWNPLHFSLPNLFSQKFEGVGIFIASLHSCFQPPWPLLCVCLFM